MPIERVEARQPGYACISALGRQRKEEQLKKRPAWLQSAILSEKANQNKTASMSVLQSTKIRCFMQVVNK